MMGNDLMLGDVYILMAMMLVIGALMARREPAARMIKMALAWVVIFAAGSSCSPFATISLGSGNGSRLKHSDRRFKRGGKRAFPWLSTDHFWVEAKLNGHDAKFLVDSGATMTTIDRATALASGVDVSPNRDQMVRTGNGIIRVSSARADELQVGGIIRRDVRLQIADTG